jgi:hypothetical protein
MSDPAEHLVSDTLCSADATGDDLATQNTRCLTPDVQAQQHQQQQQQQQQQ